MKTYSELCKFTSFEDRFRYLALDGFVGRATFGHDRYMNQRFYTSREWRAIRQHVIARDLGCDLGVEGREINSRILIHHMNPMVSDDLVHGSSEILDPEFLITTTHKTHNAIHYSDENKLEKVYAERRPGDTKLW